MTEQDLKQLNIEVQHIFDSGANEIRIIEMVKEFIRRRDEANKLPINHVSETAIKESTYLWGKSKNFSDYEDL